MIRSDAVSGLGLALASAGLAAQPHTPVPLVEPVLSTSNLVETAGGLVLVLLLILGLAWLVRRFGRFPGMAPGAVQVLGGVSLGPREKAVLLSVDGMRLLVGVAPGNIRTLHVLGEESPQAAVDESATNGFAQALKRVNHTAGES